MRRFDYAEALLLRGQVYLRQSQLEDALHDAEAVISSENELDCGNTTIPISYGFGYHV